MVGGWCVGDPTLLGQLRLLPSIGLQANPTLFLYDLQSVFLDEEVACLLQEGAIWYLLNGENAMISPLGVVMKKNGKFHPIMDI
jgi:hypothetical protein